MTIPKAPIILLKHLEHFCASHRLFNPQWTQEENLNFFGKCAGENGHGHNYKLEVAISGPIDPQTGMVCNLQVLKKLMFAHILDHVDHKHLNFDVSWLQGIIPTTENVALAMFQRLGPALQETCGHRLTLASVTLWETEKNVVTVSLP